MTYPLRVVKKRLDKVIEPGVAVIDSVIYESASEEKVSRVNTVINIVCVLWICIALLLAVVLASVYYVGPYFSLKQEEAEVYSRLAATDYLFDGVSFLSSLEAMGVEGHTVTSYADNTVLVSIPVGTELFELLQLVSRTRGVFSFQFSLDTMLVIMLRGAL
jgi:hypothetical protein